MRYKYTYRHVPIVPYTHHVNQGYDSICVLIILFCGIKQKMPSREDSTNSESLDMLPTVCPDSYIIFNIWPIKSNEIKHILPKKVQNFAK